MIRVLQGDCREVLRTLPDRSVHCVVTSPPYFGLRDYGTGSWAGGSSICDHVVGEIRTGLGLAALGERYRGGGHKAAEPKPMTAKGACPRCGAVRVDRQIGLEPTPAAYVAEMVAVFREVRRVLRDDGTVWLNLGDSYRNSDKWGGGCANTGKHTREPDGIKPKDLIGIPWRVAFALQDDGWYLRRDIIWAKPNPMPESVTDRPATAHEYVFLLTKRARYFYDADAIKEVGTVAAGTKGAKGSAERAAQPGVNSRPPEYKVYDGTRNARSVWTIATKPFSEAHFATFPPELPERCIMAGTSERGACPACGSPWARILAGWQSTCDCPPADPVPCVVLDPFGGAGTVGLVADRLQRDSVLIELNPAYGEIINRRLHGDAPLLATIATA